MFYFLSKLLYYFLMPMSWVLYLLLWAVLTRQSSKKKKLTLAAVALICFWGNGYLYNLVITAYESVPYPAQTRPSPLPFDVAIVLTGGIVEPHSTSADTSVSIGPHSDRLWQAVKLYREGKAKKILLSGGEVTITGIMSGSSESSLAKRYLLLLGIPNEDILLENQSKNTRENALLTSEILKRYHPKGQFVLCTSAFHMPRALACFRKVGINPIPYPADIRAKQLSFDWDNLYPREQIIFQWQMLLREWIGYAVYWAMGYL